MAFKFNPFTGKLDAVGSGGSGSAGATGATGAQGATGLTGAGGASGFWGSFWSNQDQSAANTTTAYPVTFNNTDPDSIGVSVVSNSRITFANAGVYNIQFSAQADRVSGSGTDSIDIWFRKNGTDIPESNGVITVAGGAAAAKTIASWNYMLKLSAGDYVELAWRTSDTNLQLIHENSATSPTRPAIPSVIVTAQQVMYTQLGPTGATGATGSVITTGAVDNAILRADGTGGATLQNSNIVVDDVATATQDNVAIVNASSATNSAFVLTPKGTGAFIVGRKPDGTTTGGNARGQYAQDLQLERGSASTVASGNYSFAAGRGCTASGAYSVSVGRDNTATQNSSFSCGQSNQASGVESFAQGFSSVASGANSLAAGITTNATATNAVAIGARTTSDRFGMLAHSGSRFAANGDAQRARFVLRCKTTTNTGVEMALDGGTTYLGIPSGKIIACTINITGSKSDGTAVAHYLRQYCVKNVGGTSSEVYAPVTIGTDNAAGTTIALSANNADDTLRILVTGIAAETWRWVASVDAVEVAYGT
jgi:hypothetical protein